VRRAVVTVLAPAQGNQAEPGASGEPALLIAGGADLTNLTYWIEVGQERATRMTG
jgi:hypothetical protein